MTGLFSLYFIAFASTAFAVSEVRSGCDHVVLLLDPRLTSAIVDRDWASGSARVERPASLELRGCGGKRLDKFQLQGPLARLDLAPVRGAPWPTYLVSVDLTAEAGSYNGPLTIPIQIVHHRLVSAQARGSDGKVEPIRLALTGKASWKKVRSSNKSDDFLSVSCQPTGQGFITYYRRYHVSSVGWRVKTRTRDEIWEADSVFPSPRAFPSPFEK